MTFRYVLVLVVSLLLQFLITPAHAQYPIFLGTGPYYVPAAAWGPGFAPTYYSPPADTYQGRSVLAAMRGNCAGGNCAGGVCNAGGVFCVQDVLAARRKAYLDAQELRRAAFLARYPGYAKKAANAATTAADERTGHSNPQ